MSYDYWHAKPLRSVDGGVKVAKPGRTDTPAAEALRDSVEYHLSPGVATRGRSYARAGQLLDFQVEGGKAAGAVQGTEKKPYRVSIEHRPAKGKGGSALVADCTCPYGCSPRHWCKHAAALGYVLVDRIDKDVDGSMAAAWGGVPVEEAPALPEVNQERLRRAQAALAALEKPGRWTGPLLLDQAAGILPLPPER